MAITLTALLFALCLLFAYFVWRRTCGGYLTFTPFFLFAVFEVVFNWPAAIYAQATGFSDAFPALLLAAAFLAFMAGYVVPLALFRFRPAWIDGFREAPLNFRCSRKSYFFALLLAGAAIGGLGIFLYRGIPPIVYFFQSLLGGENYESAIVSLSKTKEVITKEHFFGGQYRGQGAIKTILQVGWPFVTAAAYLVFHHTRKIAWLFLAAAFLVLSVIFIGGVGERFPVFMMFVYFAVFYSLLVRIRFRQMTKLLAGILLGVFVLGPLSVQMAEIGDASEDQGLLAGIAERVSRRVFLANGMNSIEAIKLVDSGALPNEPGAIHAEKFLTVLPGVAVEVPFGRRFQFLRRPESSDTSFASMTYFGILYADFGPAGVLLVYLLGGMVTAFFSIHLFRRRKDAIGMPFVASVITFFSFLSQSGPIIFAVYLLVLMVFYFLLRVLVFLFMGFHLFLSQTLARTLPETS